MKGLNNLMIMHLGKKIICVKDIPSNIIEEAIFILKSNVVENKNDKLEVKSKEIILDEAEEIVGEYLEKIESERECKSELNNKKNEKIKEIIYIAGLFIIASICIAIVI